ncbi:MAG: hypothetical protein J1D88_09925 [Treponema sp.]|nr:hypothetical protein [Treponema sp.]
MTSDKAKTCSTREEGENHHTVYATLSPEAAANSITCTSPSKSFNLAGLQFSNIIIPDEKIRRLFRRAVDQTGYDEPGLMGIAAAPKSPCASLRARTLCGSTSPHSPA